jgi:hypothetical protein
LNEEKSGRRRRGKKLSVIGDGAKLNKHVLYYPTFSLFLYKLLNLLWNHSLPVIKFLFSRNSYAYGFIFDTDQAQINSVDMAFDHNFVS